LYDRASQRQDGPSYVADVAWLIDVGIL
jgi:hypothetical protein